MDKVRKPNISESYTPSSESYSNYMEFRVQVWSIDALGNGVTTEAENVHCIKSVARKRLVETVID
jgi:hypothetical protein